jgi:hypothetical protein
MKLIAMTPQNRVLLSTITVGIIVRIKGIDVSTYFYTSGVRTTYPSGAVEFTPISCVELVFLNPKFSVQYLVYIIVFHSLKIMGLGTFGASPPLYLRNGELRGNSPIRKDV